MSSSLIAVRSGVSAVITGASFTGVTVIAKVSEAELKGAVPPVPNELTSTPVSPSARPPPVWSQALKVSVAVPL